MTSEPTECKSHFGTGGVCRRCGTIFMLSAAIVMFGEQVEQMTPAERVQAIKDRRSMPADPWRGLRHTSPAEMSASIRLGMEPCSEDAVREWLRICRVVAASVGVTE